MPLFPAVKFMDTVIGVDIHAVAPIPGIPVHPYVGPVYLWATPVFPSVNVFINGMPACTVGALGYFVHVPQGVPVPPTPTNQSYWKRYFVNIPMVLVLTGLTMLANIAIAGIASLIPKPKSAESFIKDVTGVDTSTRASTWQSIKAMFENYSKWQTWAQLLMPPLPYPGAQGSVAVGSPNVTVNGAALAFVGPLLGTSCSDIPVVPNACTLGFSNVLVGVSFADMLRGIAVAAAQRGVQAAVQHGVESAKGGEGEEAPPESEEPAEEQNNKCDDGSHPVSQATGAAWSAFTDVDAPGFRLRREVRSAWCGEDGPFGYGMRHDRQYALAFSSGRAVLIDPDNRRYVFRSGCGTAFGWTIEHPERNRFLLRHLRAGTLLFVRDADAAWLLSRTQNGRRESFVYDDNGLLERIRVTEEVSAVPLADIMFAHDAAWHVTAIALTSGTGAPVTLATYEYDEYGRLVCFNDALGGVWRNAFDEMNRLVRETNPNGYSFHYNYDAQGRCIQAAGDDGLWQVKLSYAPGRTLMTEFDQGIWAYASDENRTIIEVVDPYGGKTVRQTSRDGRVLAEIDSGGRVMRNVFDTAGGHTGRRDRWGNLWPIPDEAPKLPNPLAHGIPVTGWAREWGDTGFRSGTLDPLLPRRLGAALKVAIPPVRAGRPQVSRDLLGRIVARRDAVGGTEQYAYDKAGNRLARTDADGLSETCEFGSWNLCLARRNAAGETARFRYTRREKIAAIIDPGGAVSKYIYDCKDRLTHVTRHGVLRESYLYDSGDRLIEKLDGEGETLLTLEIGEAGLMAKRTLASGEVHRFAYDEHGNFTEASTAKAEVKLRHLGSRRVSDSRDGRGITHRWADDRLTASTWFDRFTVRYQTLTAGDTLIHLPVGQPHRITADAQRGVLRALGNGTHELSRYDPAGRCVGRARWWRGEAAPAEWTRYHYSRAGDLQRVENHRRAVTTYRYDAAHRVTGRASAQGDCAYTYDAAGNLTSTPAWLSLTYGEGNRLERGGATLFHHDTRQRLSSIETPGADPTRFHYDSLDMLVRIEGAPGCAVWEAERDGLCRRIAKIVDGARTEFFWDGDRLGAEIGPDGGVRLYLYPDSQALLPFGFIDYASLSCLGGEGRAYFVFHDQVGLPLLIEDATGREIWRAQLVDPYGAITVAPGARIAYHLRFAGHYYDAETGLHDARFRSYSPALGRFLQPDPKGQSGGLNLYAYAPNPLVQVDVLGLNHDGKADLSSKESPEQSGPATEDPSQPPENAVASERQPGEAEGAVQPEEAGSSPGKSDPQEEPATPPSKTEEEQPTAGTEKQAEEPAGVEGTAQPEEAGSPPDKAEPQEEAGTPPPQAEEEQPTTGTEKQAEDLTSENNNASQDPQPTPVTESIKEPQPTEQKAPQQAQSPNIDPKDIAGKTPAEIDQAAKGAGLVPKGPDPMKGRGAYVDPVTGEQRVLVHPDPNNPAQSHCHVNDPSGQRLDVNGNPVGNETPEAHLPLG